MIEFRRLVLYPFLLVFCASLFATGVQESGFAPKSLVQIVVPASEGGGSDIMAQAIADTMKKTQLVNVPFVVEHKPGGSGLAAIAYANGRTNPDYTLVVANTSHLLRMYANSQKLELTPIARLAEDPILFVVPTDSPFESFDDFVQESHNRQLLVGTADILDRYCVLQLKREIGGNLRSIYFNGALSIANGMMYGRLDGGILNPSEARDGLATGDLKVLAGFSDIPPSNFLPQVPTLTEMGYNGLDLRFSRYVMGPVGMSSEAVNYWSDIFAGLSQSQQWIDCYIIPSDLQSAYLNRGETDRFLSEKELPWLDMILSEGLLD